MKERSRRPLSSGAGSIVTLSVCVAGILWVLFPAELREENHFQSAGHLSRAYLAALVDKYPDEPRYRLDLAQNQLEHHEFSEALQTLTPLTDRQHPLAMTLQRQVLYTQFNSAPDLQLKQQIHSLLQALDGSQSTSKDLEMALQLGFFDWYAETQAQQKHPLSAARAMIRANRPDIALQYYEQALSAQTVEESMRAALSAGQPQKALDWLLRFPSDNPDQLRQIYDTARMAGDENAAAQAAEALITRSSSPDKFSQLALSSYIAAGNLTQARNILDRLLVTSPAAWELRYQRWRISHWQADPIAALSDARPLLEQRFSPEVFQRSLVDAYALYQYPQVIQLVRIKSLSHRLPDKEINLWMRAHQLEGDAEQALLDLQRYQLRYGASESVLSWKARLLEETGQLQRLRQLWSEFESQGNREWQSLSRFARSFWLNGDYSRALWIISDARQIPDDEQIEYWQIRASLAWHSNQREEAAQAYATLYSLGINNAQVINRYLQTGFDSDLHRLRWLWQRYQAEPQHLQLNTLMRLAWQEGDADYLSQISAELKRVNNPAGHQESWRYMSLFYQQQGDSEQALVILERALSAAPDNTETAISLGWLLVVQANQERMQPFLAQHQHRYQQSNWLPLLAAMSEALGRDSLAINYYLRWLQRSPENYAVIFSLSELLERNDLADASFRLQRFLISHLKQIPADGSGRKQALIGRFFGDAAENRIYARRFLQQGELSADELSRFYSSLLATDQAAFSSFYLGHKVWDKHQLAGWQQLQLAFLHNDPAELATLLNSDNSLSPADRMHALDRLNRPQEALMLGHESLGEGLTADEIQRVTNAWSGLRPEGFSAIQLDTQSEDALGAQNSGLTAFWPMADWQWHARVRRLDFDTEQNDSFYSLNTGAGKRFGNGRVSWQLHGDAGREDSRLGGSIGLDQAIDSHWQWQFETAWRESSPLNRAWRQLGWQNRIEAGLNYQLSARNSLSTSLAYLDHQEAGGIMDTRSWLLNLKLSEQWLFRRPNAQAYLDVTWEERENQFNPPASDQRNTQLLYTPYQRIAIGQRFWRGSVGQPPYDSPSPHWFSDASIGYRPEQADWDLHLSAGIGWRLFGDDELALKLNFQSESRQQEQFTALRLSYFLHY
ncbi:tetratricopeptide repeat protein [Marinobacterium jannaschii]|uniref:tetratricopeptide repeat protein n=1 Tax=Marinobacterium jannaschii TaxID=64970 RepID=UPI000483ED77|nr:tetratricopeptide repeat protein [Marinobacterium jannaschii]